MLQISIALLFAQCHCLSLYSLIHYWYVYTTGLQIRIESELDDLNNLDFLGHILMGQVDLIRKLNYLDVTQLSHVF